MMIRLIPWFSLAILFLSSPVFADQRSKRLEFENEVVEGDNKKSLDSLTELYEANGKRRSQLFEKREKFYDENQEILRNLTEGK